MESIERNKHAFPLEYAFAVPPKFEDQVTTSLSIRGHQLDGREIILRCQGDRYPISSEMALESKFIPILLLFSVLLFPCMNCAEDVFEYEEGSPRGPSHWGELKPEWITCARGMMQSPIDIRREDERVSRGLGRLQINYRKANAVVMTRGHDIVVEWTEDAGYLTIGSTNYSLKQSHWHTPSEHHLNGQSYDMEMHMVHISADGRIAVIGILYDIGLLGDKFLGKLVDEISILADNRGNISSVNAGLVDPYDVGIRRWDSYFRYNGSLTTPPCSEGVTWTVMKDVQKVSRRQIRTLQEAVNPGFQQNARPIQPLNGRVILLYT